MTRKILDWSTRQAPFCDHLRNTDKFSENSWTYSSSMSSNIIDRGANRNYTCKFLL